MNLSAPFIARPVATTLITAGIALAGLLAFKLLPIAFGQGAGSELRQPLGVAIVGGLLVSQWLTLYTTPVIYLYLERLSGLLGRSHKPSRLADALTTEPSHGPALAKESHGGAE